MAKSSSKVSQAMLAKALVEKKLLSFKGVVGVDVGFQRKEGKPSKTVAIRVFVKPQERRQLASLERAIPKVVRGIPVDIVEEEFVPLSGRRAIK